MIKKKLIFLSMLLTLGVTSSVKTVSKDFSFGNEKTFADNSVGPRGTIGKNEAKIKGGASAFGFTPIDFPKIPNLVKCINCGETDIVYGDYDETTLCSNCNEPLLVWEGHRCINCHELQPIQTYNPTSVEPIPELEDLLGNNDNEDWPIFMGWSLHGSWSSSHLSDLINVDISEVFPDIPVNWESRPKCDSNQICVNCGLPVGILYETRCCANPFCESDNLVPADSPYDILCQNCGLHISTRFYKKCKNCKNRNPLENEKCWICELPVDVLYEKRVCANKNCGFENLVPADSPDDILCQNCGCCISSKYYRPCVNCHELNSNNKEVCFNCNCLVDYFSFTCSHCNKLNEPYKTDIDFDSCCNVGEECCKQIYRLEKCIHCEKESRVYLDYQGKERIFYKNDEGKYVDNGKQCPYCHKEFSYSPDYTVIDTRLQYTRTIFDETFENFPLCSCAAILRTSDGNHSFKAISGTDGYIRFKIPNEELSRDIGQLNLTFYPTDDVNNEIIRIVDNDGNAYSKNSGFSIETDFNHLKRGALHYIDIDPICVDENYTNKAFYIGHFAMIARDFAKDMLASKGIQIPRLEIIYPAYHSHFEEITAGGFHEDGTIFLSYDNFIINGETIMHEYGHAIQHLLDTIDRPSYHGDHYDYENHIHRKTENENKWPKILNLTS